jgi:BlaI family transcriptional regulator, penicillinase repressor
MSDVPVVPEAELSVLRALWDDAPRTARQLAEALYGSAGRNEMGTVQKLLQRLEAKALIIRERHPDGHRFFPSMTRGTFAGRQLEQLADKLTEGSLTPFLTHFVKGRRLSKKDREDIRRLLDGRNRNS